VDIALAGLKRMLTGLSNLVLVQPSKEWVFKSWVDPKLVVGLGKEHPAVKSWATVIGGMESAEGSPTDKLDCSKCILEPPLIFPWRYDKLPSINIHWLRIESVDWRTVF
jgi:hypothetical protein